MTGTRKNDPHLVYQILLTMSVNPPLHSSRHCQSFPPVCVHIRTSLPESSESKCTHSLLPELEGKREEGAAVLSFKETLDSKLTELFWEH